jgi:hypothetical protein|tara:strand:+ start:1407 stop:1517 length:111 start_codon:yes stop_codon:yes gene_type:complete
LGVSAQQQFSHAAVQKAVEAAVKLLNPHLNTSGTAA